MDSLHPEILTKAWVIAQEGYQREGRGGVCYQVPGERLHYVSLSQARDDKPVSAPMEQYDPATEMVIFLTDVEPSGRAMARVVIVTKAQVDGVTQHMKKKELDRIDIRGGLNK